MDEDYGTECNLVSADTSLRRILINCANDSQSHDFVVFVCESEAVSRTPLCLSLCNPTYLACREMTDGTVKGYAFEQYSMGQWERNAGFGVTKSLLGNSLTDFLAPLWTAVD